MMTVQSGRREAISTLRRRPPTTTGSGITLLMTFGPGGMRPHGRQQGRRRERAVKNANNYAGFWRIGGGSLSGLTSRPTSDFFAGDIDDVAIYPCTS